MKRVRRRPKRPWKQAIYLWLGILLIPVGIIVAPLPGPGGIPILAVAALLIVTSSRRAASWVRLHRGRWDWMHEILLKGEGWLGGEMGRALRRTNGRKLDEPAKPPASRKERILDILLFPVHVGIILTRAVASRYGWKLPGDARRARKAEIERARRARRREKRLRELEAASLGEDDVPLAIPGEEAAGAADGPDSGRDSGRKRTPVPASAGDSAEP